MLQCAGAPILCDLCGRLSLCAFLLVCMGATSGFSAVVIVWYWWYSVTFRWKLCCIWFYNSHLQDSAESLVPTLLITGLHLNNVGIIINTEDLRMCCMMSACLNYFAETMLHVWYQVTAHRQTFDMCICVYYDSASCFISLQATEVDIWLPALLSDSQS